MWSSSHRRTRSLANVFPDFTPRLLCSPHLLEKVWFRWWEKVVHGQGQAAFGPSVASRLSEASGLPEEVPSVLKVADFVFTENPLQALVLRTLGMAICGTSVWPLAVPVGQAGQGACPVPSRLQGLSVACCMSWASVRVLEASQIHTLNAFILKWDLGVNVGKNHN